MSIEAVHWALSVPVGGSAKVILLGLANHAHPDGSESYPALSTLAKYGNCDRSTARRNVRKLVIDGWVEEQGNGPQGQRKYRLLLDRHTGVAKCDGGVASAPAGGGKTYPRGDAPMPPEPSFNRPEEQPPKSPASGGPIADLRLVEALAPTARPGNRQRDLDDYHAEMVVWSAAHFPGADPRAVGTVVADARRALGPNVAAADVETWARTRGDVWAHQLGLTTTEGSEAA